MVLGWLIKTSGRFWGYLTVLQMWLKSCSRISFTNLHSASTVTCLQNDADFQLLKKLEPSKILQKHNFDSTQMLERHKAGFCRENLKGWQHQQTKQPFPEDISGRRIRRSCQDMRTKPQKKDTLYIYICVCSIVIVTITVMITIVIYPTSAWSPQHFATT
jgi:hypothetical protein